MKGGEGWGGGSGGGHRSTGGRMGDDLREGIFCASSGEQ